MMPRFFMWLASWALSHLVFITQHSFPFHILMFAASLNYILLHILSLYVFMFIIMESTRPGVLDSGKTHIKRQHLSPRASSLNRTDRKRMGRKVSCPKPHSRLTDRDGRGEYWSHWAFATWWQSQVSPQITWLLSLWIMLFLHCVFCRLSIVSLFWNVMTFSGTPHIHRDLPAWIHLVSDSSRRHLSALWVRQQVSRVLRIYVSLWDLKYQGSP